MLSEASPTTTPVPKTSQIPPTIERELGFPSVYLKPATCFGMHVFTFFIRERFIGDLDNATEEPIVDGMFFITCAATGGRP